MRTSASRASTLSPISAFDNSVWIENISAIWSPMVQRIERRHRLLKDHAMPAPRTSRISATDAAQRSRPRTSPGRRRSSLRWAAAASRRWPSSTCRSRIRRPRRGSRWTRSPATHPERMRPVRAAGQADAQAIEREDGLGPHRPLSLGLSASLRPWPTSDTASTVTRMAMPIAETYHCTRSTSRPTRSDCPTTPRSGRTAAGRPARFQQYRDRHHHAGIDDHRRQRIGQDLAEDELDVLHAERPAGLDEFAVAQRR